MPPSTSPRSSPRRSAVASIRMGSRLWPRSALWQVTGDGFITAFSMAQERRGVRNVRIVQPARDLIYACVGRLLHPDLDPGTRTTGLVENRSEWSKRPTQGARADE